MMFLIRFWRSLTKKDSVESAKYDIQIFSSRTSVFGRFFHGSGSSFFRIGSGLLVNPDTDSGKKFDPLPTGLPSEDFRVENENSVEKIVLGGGGVEGQKTAKWF